MATDATVPCDQRKGMALGDGGRRTEEGGRRKEEGGRRYTLCVSMRLLHITRPLTWIDNRRINVAASYCLHGGLAIAHATLVS